MACQLIPDPWLSVPQLPMVWLLVIAIKNRHAVRACHPGGMSKSSDVFVQKQATCSFMDGHEAMVCVYFYGQIQRYRLVDGKLDTNFQY